MKKKKECMENGGYTIIEKCSCLLTLLKMLLIFLFYKSKPSINIQSILKIYEIL